MPPCTKMIALDDPRCSIRLSEVWLVARTFRAVGVHKCQIWDRATTDWAPHSLYEYVNVSITDHHTVLVRFPDVANLTSFAETVGQAYGLCQTIDPRPPDSRLPPLRLPQPPLPPSRKGKERAYD